MFWTDWDGKLPRIERATMYGKDRRNVFNVTTVKGGWPNGLTIDYLQRRIYWIDARYELDFVHSVRNSKRILDTKVLAIRYVRIQVDSRNIKRATHYLRGEEYIDSRKIHSTLCVHWWYI